LVKLWRNIVNTYRAALGMGKQDKVFYSLCEDDILEVANALGVELTPDEMTRAKSTVADSVGGHWWDVTEDVIGDILRERR